jgi:arginyl-tRNA synthetase
MSVVTDDLATMVREAIAAACADGALPPACADGSIEIETPRNKQFGDYATNVALALARTAGIASREVARILVEHMPVEGTPVAAVEIAGPGFINFRLRTDWLHDAMVTVEEQGGLFGRNTSMAGRRILIEFVSANPTGPISVVNGRAAALGDSLRRLFTACGAQVNTEFYVNDALNSTQIDLLGASLAARYMQHFGGNDQVPPDGYQGEYLIEMARDIAQEAGAIYCDLPAEERAKVFRKLAAERMIAQQREDLAAFGVEFDRWFFESSLYESGEVAAAIEQMKQAGWAYMRDGALWLKTVELAGDDQDRVLVRSNERETYVAADAAYHKNKFERGFTHLVNIWGADHHGYVARLKAGIAALGYDPARCTIILTQMVLLTRGGELVRGSKRAGDIVPLVDLVEEIGRDAARYYCLLTSYDTTATFDLETAKQQSNDNPVYYAQYAHARCAAVLRRAIEDGVAVRPASEVNRSLLVHPKELELLRTLAAFPREVRQAAEAMAPHRLTAYVRVIGQALHQFYEECPALKEGVPPELRDARLALFETTRAVVANLLDLLGVSAPERM